MEDKELEIELVDDSTDEGDDTDDSNEETLSSDSDESESGDEENTSSTKSKKSNWKKLAKLNKALLAENKRLRAEKSKSDEDEDEDFDDEDEDLGTFDKTEFRFFTIENPEAKQFAKEIEKIVTNHPNMSFEDALLLVKAKQPKTSVSSTDFGTKSANTKVRKTISQITPEEALKLPPEQYLKWARAT